MKKNIEEYILNELIIIVNNRINEIDKYYSEYFSYDEIQKHSQNIFITSLNPILSKIEFIRFDIYIKKTLSINNNSNHQYQFFNDFNYQEYIFNEIEKTINESINKIDKYIKSHFECQKHSDNINYILKNVFGDIALLKLKLLKENETE